MATLEDLRNTIWNYPMIDNHAHPLLLPPYQKTREFESVVSEAHGEALGQSVDTLAHYRAVKQLAQLYECEEDWEEIKTKRREKQAAPVYSDTITTCFEGIQCLLLDDGLDKPNHCLGWEEHGQFTASPSKRLVRIEQAAEELYHRIQKQWYKFAKAENEEVIYGSIQLIINSWKSDFENLVKDTISDEDVVGFKSIICYRTGLRILSREDISDSVLEKELHDWFRKYHEHHYSILEERVSIDSKIKNKVINSWLLHKVCQISFQHQSKEEGYHLKPIQFHTGLGDNDLSLLEANPAHLEGFIRSYPDIPIVLLHSSYPYTREAGYLASVYPNVHVDFGEAIPMLSKNGQVEIVKQMLELTPVSKLLWSSDGHWFPETFFLGSWQTREVFDEVLPALVKSGALDYEQAVNLVKAAYFQNSNCLYKLALAPQTKDLSFRKMSERSGANVYEGGQPTQPAEAAELVREPVPKPSEEPPDCDAIIVRLDVAYIKFVRVQWVDLTNTLRLRIIPFARVKKKIESGLNLQVTNAVLSLAQDDQLLHEASVTGMYLLDPDWRSLVAFNGTGHAAVMSDIRQRDRTDMNLCPRTALRKAVELARKEFGIEFLAGVESEVVFIWRDIPTKKLDTKLDHGHAWSAASAVNDNYFGDLTEAIAEALQEAGIELLMYHPESADGQFEFVTGHGPIVESIDRLYHTRQIIERVASENGFRATFHPKPYKNQAGTSAHVHFSVNNVTAKKGDHFVAGILDHLKSLSAVFMASFASYDRLADGCWAGGTWVAWGEENRETPLRLCTGSSPHWELRCIDGTANMYLAMAAMIHAGLDGIRRLFPLQPKSNITPAFLTKEQREDLGITKTLPRSLSSALYYLDADKVLKEALGDIVGQYVQIKNMELEKRELRLMREASTSEYDNWEWEVFHY